MNEQISEGLVLLFENYWILRKKSPREYTLLRQIEKDLRKIISEKFGFRLTMHTDFIKLEKLPVDPEPWMGMENFTQTMDYVIFSCLLSILEGKETGEYFLLSQLCEELKAIYPEGGKVDWVNYNHRKSFVRAMQQMLELNLLETVDGDLMQFAQNEDAEVLYRSTVYSRYFMRPYPQDIYTYNSWQDLLEDDRGADAEQISLRHRVYRRLFLQPVLSKEKLSTEEFYYLRNQRQSIIDFTDKYTPYNFELYLDTAFLSLLERNTRIATFPSRQGIDDVVLHTAALLREKNLERNEEGKLVFSHDEWKSFLQEVKERYSAGWTKQYREETDAEQLQTEVLAQCEKWGFAFTRGDEILINPVMVRIVGVYPEDFCEGELR
ncbi:TIGR02678 family protein [Treponema phagedenis]|uniref:TIGR02678 family protein n=1 Tax=Treponema phagedenis TaxID=162 RepID=UPI0001F63B5E|nr:TIGR02678 family protein [Treponema phagedenis]EFW38612.1 TIGR02678 family protein [Treponema phagedenis F0421]TYT79130.1 TIGR02678 family protein [Treponema phagedenis]